MRNNSGFILLSSLLLFLGCLLLLTTGALAFSAGLQTQQKTKQLQEALSIAQLENLEEASNIYTLTINDNYPLKELQVYYDSRLILNLFYYQP